MNIKIDKLSNYYPIRSFVLRKGHITNNQEYAINNLLGNYGLPKDKKTINYKRIFGRTAPTIVEIGFGNGESLIKMANKHSRWNYIGLEVYRAGIGKVLNYIQKMDFVNIRVAYCDANEVFKKQIQDNTLFGIQLYFPDPWQKTRHNKRRIVQPEWITLIHKKLYFGGFLHIITDCKDYAIHIDSVIKESKCFANLNNSTFLSKYCSKRPKTKFILM